jgi:hypothetical protein
VRTCSAEHHPFIARRQLKRNKEVIAASPTRFLRQLRTGLADSRTTYEFNGSPKTESITSRNSASVGENKAREQKQALSEFQLFSIHTRSSSTSRWNYRWISEQQQKQNPPSDCKISRWWTGFAVCVSSVKNFSKNIFTFSGVDESGL